MYFLVIGKCLAEYKLAEYKLAEYKLAEYKLAEYKLAEYKLAEYKCQTLAKEKQNYRLFFQFS
jgi:hypothetical protein